MEDASDRAHDIWLWLRIETYIFFRAFLYFFGKILHDSTLFIDQIAFISLGLNKLESNLLKLFVNFFYSLEQLVGPFINKIFNIFNLIFPKF